MWNAILPALISGGATLLGGAMQSGATGRAARLNAIAQANEAAASREYNERIWREQMGIQKGWTDEANALAIQMAQQAWERESVERQKERDLQFQFAQHGVQWKVDDARAAGIHPLAALGAQTISYSPQSVGVSPPSISGASVPGAPQTSPSGIKPFAASSMGSSIAQMGQDISRAISATRDEVDRTEAYNKTVQDLNVTRMGLENEMLASQIAKINQAGSPPAMPSGGRSRSAIVGQGAETNLVKDEPLKRVAGNPDEPSQERAPITDTGYTQTRKGFHPVMSQDAKERLEEDWPGMIIWNVRNRLGPYFGAGNTPKEDPGKGREWYWHPLFMEYRSRKKPEPVQGVPAFNPNW